ncbi:ALI_collapsed_G0025420.mRNA.1.CDS.1 [Saccharomyces cerevisiae]|nr:ALI_collapsed_G0025420.mRNA.1.CDS.1 [Saccharomyces cerevisiae]
MFLCRIKLNELPKKSQLIAALKKTHLQNILEPLKFCDLVEYHHDWDHLGKPKLTTSFKGITFHTTRVNLYGRF